MVSGPGMPTDGAATGIDFDVVIIGDGVIGLSTALELGLARLRTPVVGARRDGSASGAAAGLLAPSIGRLEPAVRAVFEASLARYPEFCRRLAHFDSGVELLEGLLQVSAAPQADPPPGSTRLDSAGVSDMEPSLVAPRGGLFHPRDAAIDNVRLMTALERAVDRQPSVTVTRDDAAAQLAFDASRARITTRSGRDLTAHTVVLAAGAWSAQLPGLPRALPVVPLKGQMLALRDRTLRHPVAGDDIYLVPRGEEIVAGATVERAGFDTSVDSNAIDALHAAAARLCPPLAQAPVVRRWAGIRPGTPDLLPILGHDPDVPALIYACGHSKNGILLAPETAVIVTRLVQNLPVELDLSRFNVARFAGATQNNL
jgi:glycine/D-amino acid oxidase-like deaminating enzyme